MKLVYIAIVVCLTGCGSDQEPVEPKLSAIQEQIFSQSCAFGSCHGGRAPSGDMSLEAGKAFDAIVDVESPNEGIMRVIPGDPTGSLLIMALEGGSGDVRRMPLNGSIDDEDVQAIRDWISMGAAND